MPKPAVRVAVGSRQWAVGNRQSELGGTRRNRPGAGFVPVAGGQRPAKGRICQIGDVGQVRPTSAFYIVAVQFAARPNRNQMDCAPRVRRLAPASAIRPPKRLAAPIEPNGR